MDLNVWFTSKYPQAGISGRILTGSGMICVYEAQTYLPVMLADIAAPEATEIHAAISILSPRVFTELALFHNHNILNFMLW